MRKKNKSGYKKLLISLTHITSCNNTQGEFKIIVETIKYVLKTHLAQNKQKCLINQLTRINFIAHQFSWTMHQQPIEKKKLSQLLLQ